MKYLSLLLIIFFLLIFSTCRENKQSLKTPEPEHNPTVPFTPDSSPVPRDKEYMILYQRYSNTLTDINNIKGLMLYEYLTGGMIKRDGRDNKILNYKGYLTGYMVSKKYDNYFYISSSSSPVKKISQDYYYIDFNIKNQTLWAEDKGNTEKIASYGEDKFPGILKASGDNKYIAYVMTKIDKKDPSGMNIFDPYLKNSELIIYDTETRTSKILLNNYNRQLFRSFLTFSEDNRTLYTIKYEKEKFKFITIEVDTGKITEFNKIFPSFKWSKVNPEELFKNKSQPYFHFSPDKTRLLVYKNYSINSASPGDVACKLIAIKIPENKIETYLEQKGFIQDLTWKYDSKEFAFILLDSCGCYPGTIDSSIIKMNREGKEKEILVFKKQNKISSLGWSPDGKEIGFSDYGMDFIGKIETVFPKTKEIREIITTGLTDKKINKRPVLLHFLDWVSIKN